MTLTMEQQLFSNKREYYRLLKDGNYTDVRFNPKNGALMAIHKEHNFDKQKGQYEKNVQKIGFDNGNAVIFESETGKAIGQRYTEGLWNGKSFEIASAETGTSNNIKKGLNHCASKPGGSGYVKFDEIICLNEEGLLYNKKAT